MAVSLSACAGIAKPVGKIGVVHTKGLPGGAASYINEFDFETDFDDEGNVKPGVKGTHRQLSSLADLDKGVWSSAASYASANAFKKKVFDRLKKCEAGK